MPANGSKTTAIFRKAQLRSASETTRLLLALIGPPLIVFASSSVDLLKRNYNYFGSDLSNARLILLAGCIYLIIGSAGLYVRSLSSILRASFYTYLLSGPLWIAYSAMMGLTGKGAIIGFIGLAVFGGACIARAKKLAEPLVDVLSVISLAILAMIIFAALQLRQGDPVTNEPVRHGFERDVGARGESPAAQLPDIYHIVFDEFQTDMFEAVLDDELKKELRGAIWFPNSSTPFGRTEMALASLFAGAPYAYHNRR